MSLPKISHVIIEQSGLAWYELQVSTDTFKVTDDTTWPEMDNTDTGITGFVLEDGRIVRNSDHDKETGDEFTAIQTALEQSTAQNPDVYLTAWDELEERAREAMCEEWPSDELRHKEQAALNRMNVLLSAPEWGVGMLEDLCSILRTVRTELPADRAGWEPH